MADGGASRPLDLKASETIEPIGVSAPGAARIKGLDHWAITTGNEQRCIAFYEGVLGLRIGPRPMLTFQGVWFYAGERPIVHVISDRAFVPGKTGAFDHVAFSMEGSHLAMEKTLRSNGIEFQSRLIERTGVYQIMCRDPDGCGVELNFQAVRPVIPASLPDAKRR